jgi:hypothetical protein
MPRPKPPPAVCPGPGRYSRPCGRPVRAHGLCAGHYQQHVRGTPLRPLRSPAGRIGAEPLERLSLRVHALVATEVERAGADMVRELLGLWALERIRARDGAAAARSAGEEIAEYPAMKRPRPTRTRRTRPRRST